jgi:uncharacterized protein YraI
MKKKLFSMFLLTAVIGANLILPRNLVKADTVKEATTKTTNSTVTPNTAGIFTVTAASGANIRKGPGTNYSIIGAVPKGTELQLASPLSYKDTSGGTWYYVVYGTKYGYISATTGYAS